QGHGEGAAGEPDERLSGPEDAPRHGAHRYRYLRRKRSRTTSATVLTANVRQKRRKAARNSTRNSVPPSGASGSSTATLADSARNPLNGDQLISGVLPVAIRTIIVSPTAPPKTINTGGKIPE